MFGDNALETERAAGFGVSLRKLVFTYVGMGITVADHHRDILYCFYRCNLLTFTIRKYYQLIIKLSYVYITYLCTIVPKKWKSILTFV